VKLAKKEAFEATLPDPEGAAVLENVADLGRIPPASPLPVVVDRLLRREGGELSFKEDFDDLPPPPLNFLMPFLRLRRDESLLVVNKEQNMITVYLGILDRRAR